ncbi:MAG TPA: DUF3857 domain-containing protein [Gemmataceae bacterium]|nr:DUF3857 domain-containing protein [Gemmataceae bacterium]
MVLSHRPITLLATLLIASYAQAAKEWPVPRGPSREPDPYAYNPADWKGVPKDFLDDAPACYLRSWSTHLVEEDGTVETITHEVMRLNSRKAVEQLGEHRSITYVPDYEALTLNAARVHKPDGKIVEVEARHVQLRDVGTDYFVYGTDKQLIVSFPTLAAGDVIEVKWTVRGKNPEYRGHFFYRYSFGDDRYPVVNDGFRVRLPKDRPLKYATVNPQLAGGKFEPKVVASDTNRTFTWEARNRRQQPRDDHLPPKEELRLGVAVSTMQSWDDVRDWKLSIREKCWECTQDLKAIVAEVTKGLDKSADKARALTYWVRRNVRYVSTGERHDFTPTTPAAVVANRFGDCKDTTQLLAVLLKEAGIPAGLVALGVRGDGQILESVPSPWGTHALLLVSVDGKDHWIDTTASLCGWDFLPDTDRDRVVYVFDDKGLRLMRTPALAPEDDRTDLQTTINLRRNGDSVADRTMTSTGSSALARRDDWVDVPAGERRRLMTTELQDANSKSRLKSLEIDEKALKDYDGPVRARVRFEIPGHLSGEPNREGSITDSEVWGRLLAVTVDPERSAALDLGAPFELTHRFTVAAPPGCRLTDPPADKTAKSQWGVFRRTVSADDGGRKWTIDFEARVHGTRIEPKELDEFRQWQEAIAAGYRTYLTLRTVTEAAEAKQDIPLLTEFLKKEPRDKEGWLELLRLQDIAGNYGSAADAADAALTRFPGDRNVIEAAAGTSRDPDRAERLWGELIKKYPMEPKYALALGRDLVTFTAHAKARPVLEKLAKHEDDAVRAEAEFQLARLSLAEKTPSEARKHFEAAAEADRDVTTTPAGYMLDGNIREELKEYKAAAAAYARAADADPDALEPMRRRVGALIKAGEVTEARDALRQWVVAAEGDRNELAQAADACLALGCDADAIDLATRSIDGDNGSLAARVLGIALARRGSWQGAVEALRKVSPKDHSAEAFKAWADSVIALGRLSDLPDGPGKVLGEVATEKQAVDLIAMIDRAKALRATVPDNKGKLVDQFVCAEYLAKTGRHSDRAAALLGDVLQSRPDFGPALALRAQQSLDRGRLIQALPDAEKAIESSPEEARGYFVRGRIRLERGLPGVMMDLRKAVELTGSKDGRMLHWLAFALAEEGRKDDALKVQEQAAKLLPKDAEVLDLLKTLKTQK